MWMVFADVVLESLGLTGREVTEVTWIAETLMSCLLVSPQITWHALCKMNVVIIVYIFATVTREIVAPVTHVALVFNSLMNWLLVKLQVRGRLGPEVAVFNVTIKSFFNFFVDQKRVCEGLHLHGTTGIDLVLVYCRGRTFDLLNNTLVLCQIHLILNPLPPPLHSWRRCPLRPGRPQPPLWRCTAPGCSPRTCPGCWGSLTTLCKLQ